METGHPDINFVDLYFFVYRMSNQQLWLYGDVSSSDLSGDESQQYTIKLYCVKFQSQSHSSVSSGLCDAPPWPSSLCDVPSCPSSAACSWHSSLTRINNLCNSRFVGASFTASRKSSKAAVNCLKLNVVWL